MPQKGTRNLWRREKGRRFRRGGKEKEFTILGVDYFEGKKATNPQEKRRGRPVALDNMREDIVRR